MANDVEQGKACAILAWIFPIGLIWYLVDEKMKKNVFAGFHVKQSLVLFILWIAVWIVGSILFFIGWLLIPIGGLLIFILWIIGIVYAATGKQKELPLIGQFGEKFKF